MIIIRGLNKAFGEKIIFSNFNLEIPDGSFVVISGDSGSGKSTLLNMIGGIEKPDSGSIIIEGLNITRLKNKNSFFADTVGFLFQNFALLENKTVKENLSLIKKSSRTKVSLKEALNRVGLSKEVNKKVYQLSGGEQQRVALARLMMKKCSVVLADEPTGSLDKKNRDIVMRLLHELNEEGKTVIIVTHDQGIIEDEPYVVKICRNVYSTTPFSVSSSLALSTESTPVLFLIGANSFLLTTSKGRQLSIWWIISSTRLSNL